MSVETTSTGNFYIVYLTEMAKCVVHYKVVKDIGNMWVSGNPSRAVTMLCSSMEGNTRTSENKQLLPPQDADTAAVINLLGVFNTNDSHFSVPVSLELLPKLERLMATSSLMEDRWIAILLVLY